MYTSTYYASLIHDSSGATLTARFDASDASTLVQLDGKTTVPLAGSADAPIPIPMWNTSPDSGWGCSIGSTPAGVTPATPPSAYPSYTTFGGAPALVAGGAWWHITDPNAPVNNFLPVESVNGWAFLAAFRLPTQTSGVYTMWNVNADGCQIRWDASAKTLSLLYETADSAGYVIAPIPLPNINLPYGDDSGDAVPPPLIISYLWETAGMYVGINGTRVLTLDATTISAAGKLPKYIPKRDLSSFAGGDYAGIGGLNAGVTWNGGAFHELIFLSATQAPSVRQITAGEAYLASKWCAAGAWTATDDGGSGDSGSGCPPCISPPSAAGLSPLAVGGITLAVSVVLVAATVLLLNARAKRRQTATRVRVPMVVGVPPIMFASGMPR